MFSFEDAGQMQQEVTWAEQFAKKHHDPLRDMVSRYATAWYRTDINEEPSPENHVFAYIDFMRAQLTYNSPRALVEANWENIHRDLAQFMEECLYRWGATYPLMDNFDLVVRDALFGYGVVKLGMEETGDTQGEVGGRRPQLRPYMAHVPMESWGCDPRCEHVKDARFQYHRYERDLNEIEQMRGIDPASLKKVNQGYDQSGGINNTTGRVGLPDGQTAYRERQVLYDIWIPEAKMIATLLAGSKGQPLATWLRPPRKWWGPSEGPFRVLGFCSVPGDPYPCSPLSPVMQQIEKLNVHLVAEADEVATTKRFLGVDAAASEAGEKFKLARNGEVVPIPNLRSSGAEMFEFGGISKDRIIHTDRLKERVQRMLSMGDAQQGVSNSDTATANSIAQNNADVRVSHMKGILNHFCKSCFVGVGWYMFYDPNYEERITLDQPPTGAMPGIISGMPTMDTGAAQSGGIAGPNQGINAAPVQPGMGQPMGGSPVGPWPFHPQLAENPSQPGAMSFQYAPGGGASGAQAAPPVTPSVGMGQLQMGQGYFPQQPMNRMGMGGEQLGMGQSPIQQRQSTSATIFGGVEGGWYDGVWFPPLTDVSWEDDFTVVIDPESTAYTSNQARQQDALALVSLAQTAYQMLATMQGLDVEYLVNTAGEAMNRRNLFSQLFEPGVVAMLRQRAAMQQMTQPMPLPNGAAPAMAHQVGSFGGGGAMLGGGRFQPGSMGGGQPAGPGVQAAGQASPRSSQVARPTSPVGG